MTRPFLVISFALLACGPGGTSGNGGGGGATGGGATGGGATGGGATGGGATGGGATGGGATGGGTTGGGVTGGGATGGGTGGGVPGLANGAVCASNSVCQSQFCVDGVCCSSACTGSCEACTAVKTGATDGQCSPRLPSTCRPSAGPCDVAESCDGTSTTCPADLFRRAGQSCGAASGDCDLVDVCDGTSAACPDAMADAGTLCRLSFGACDVPEVCTGTSHDCPTDEVLDASTVCRNATGACDVPDFCSGVSPVCGADVLIDAGTECRAAAGVCDQPEVCTGVTSDCPTDAKLQTTTICRASAGLCDVLERCNGTSDTCPADQFLGTTASVCAPYACTAGAACATSCAVDSDCAQGDRFICNLGQCVRARLAFVTSQQVNPNFGGAIAGDTLCSTLAADAGLGSNFKSWVADGTTSPALRFNQSPAIYIRMVDKLRLAGSWSELTDGSLGAAISYTERRTIPAMGTRHTLTGVNPNGGTQGNNCNGWTSSAMNVTGMWGTCDANMATWSTAGTATPCSTLVNGRLYCFEQ